jgi:hypothetical protein
MVVAGDAPSASAEPETAVRERRAPGETPEGVDVHAVTEKPSSPRRGWWQRLIQ